LDNRHAVLHCC